MSYGRHMGRARHHWRTLLFVLGLAVVALGVVCFAPPYASSGSTGEDKSNVVVNAETAEGVPDTRSFEEVSCAGIGGGQGQDVAASPSDASAAEGERAGAYPLRAMFDAGAVSSIELVGDSITAGYGTDGYVMPSAATGTPAICTAAGTTYYETPVDVRCWANDFCAYATEHGVGAFTNRGICGWTMHDLATYGPGYVMPADVIVCMLGTNDTVNHSLDTFRKDTRTALALLADRCRLLVVMTPPQTDWTQSGYAAYFTPQDTAQVLDEVCCEAGYLHISNLDVIRLDSDLINADNVHPTTRGSDAIWANMQEQLGLS